MNQGQLGSNVERAIQEQSRAAVNWKLASIYGQVDREDYDDDDDDDDDV